MRPSLLHRSLVALALAFACAAAAAQATFPSKPIRFLSPFAPGGPTDAIARLVGQKLSDRLGQQIVMDYRPGGSGVIAADALAKAAPDGHTMMISINTLAINATLMPRLPYDTLKDLQPVATLASAEFLLVLSAATPGSNLREFVEAARRRAEPMSFGTVGTAGIGRLAGEMFSQEARIPMLLVPYKGAALLNTDLLGGRLNYTIDPAYSHIPAVKAGTLKALAVTGSSRLPGLPDVPTFTEAGLPNFDARMWFGVFMPGGTPRDLVQRMSGEIAQVLAMPDVRSQLLAREFTPFVSTPEQFSALLRSDMERYARIIRSANIKPE